MLTKVGSQLENALQFTVISPESKRAKPNTMIFAKFREHYLAVPLLPSEGKLRGRIGPSAVHAKAVGWEDAMSRLTNKDTELTILSGLPASGSCQGWRYLAEPLILLAM